MGDSKLSTMKLTSGLKEVMVKLKTNPDLIADSHHQRQIEFIQQELDYIATSVTSSTQQVDFGKILVGVQYYCEEIGKIWLKKQRSDCALLVCNAYITFLSRVGQSRRAVNQLEDEPWKSLLESQLQESACFVKANQLSLLVEVCDYSNARRLGQQLLKTLEKAVVGNKRTDLGQILLPVYLNYGLASMQAERSAAESVRVWKQGLLVSRQVLKLPEWSARFERCLKETSHRITSYASSDKESSAPGSKSRDGGSDLTDEHQVPKPAHGASITVVSHGRTRSKPESFDFRPPLRRDSSALSKICITRATNRLQESAVGHLRNPEKGSNYLKTRRDLREMVLTRTISSHKKKNLSEVGSSQMFEPPSLTVKTSQETDFRGSEIGPIQRNGELDKLELNTERDVPNRASHRPKPLLMVESTKSVRVSQNIKPSAFGSPHAKTAADKTPHEKKPFRIVSEDGRGSMPSISQRGEHRHQPDPRGMHLKNSAFSAFSDRKQVSQRTFGGKTPDSGLLGPSSHGMNLISNSLNLQAVSPGRSMVSIGEVLSSELGDKTPNSPKEQEGMDQQSTVSITKSFIRRQLDAFRAEEDRKRNDLLLQISNQFNQNFDKLTRMIASIQGSPQPHLAPDPTMATSASNNQLQGGDNELLGITQISGNGAAPPNQASFLQTQGSIGPAHGAVTVNNLLGITNNPGYTFAPNAGTDTGSLPSGPNVLRQLNASAGAKKRKTVQGGRMAKRGLLLERDRFISAADADGDRTMADDKSLIGKGTNSKRIVLPFKFNWKRLRASILGQSISLYQVFQPTEIHSTFPKIEMVAQLRCDPATSKLVLSVTFALRGQPITFIDLPRTASEPLTNPAEELRKTMITVESLDDRDEKFRVLLEPLEIPEAKLVDRLSTIESKNFDLGLFRPLVGSQAEYLMSLLIGPLLHVSFKPAKDKKDKIISVSIRPRPPGITHRCEVVYQGQDYVAELSHRDDLAFRLIWLINPKKLPDERKSEHSVVERDNYKQCFMSFFFLDKVTFDHYFYELRDRESRIDTSTLQTDNKLDESAATLSEEYFLGERAKFFELAGLGKSEFKQARDAQTLPKERRIRRNQVDFKDEEVYQKFWEALKVTLRQSLTFLESECKMPLEYHVDSLPGADPERNSNSKPLELKGTAEFADSLAEKLKEWTFFIKGLNRMENFIVFLFKVLEASKQVVVSYYYGSTELMKGKSAELKGIHKNYDFGYFEQHYGVPDFGKLVFEKKLFFLELLVQGLSIELKLVEVNSNTMPKPGNHVSSVATPKTSQMAAAGGHDLPNESLSPTMALGISMIEKPGFSRLAGLDQNLPAKLASSTILDEKKEANPNGDTSIFIYNDEDNSARLFYELQLVDSPPNTFAFTRSFRGKRYRYPLTISCLRVKDVPVGFKILLVDETDLSQMTTFIALCRQDWLTAFVGQGPLIDFVKKSVKKLGSLVLKKLSLLKNFHLVVNDPNRRDPVLNTFEEEPVEHSLDSFERILCSQIASLWKMSGTTDTESPIKEPP